MQCNELDDTDLDALLHDVCFHSRTSVCAPGSPVCVAVTPAHVHVGVGCAGLVLHKHRDFRRALADLRRVVAGATPSSSSTQSKSDEPAVPENLKVVWNFVGLCEANLGHVAEALQAYDQALKIDPGFKEARLNKVRTGLRQQACRQGL